MLAAIRAYVTIGTVLDTIVSRTGITSWLARQ